MEVVLNNPRTRVLSSANTSTTCTSVPTVSIFEKFLLISTVIAFYFERMLPKIDDFTTLRFLFFLILSYAVLFRLSFFIRYLFHPLMCYLFLFLLFIILRENFFDDARYREIFSLFQVMLGMVSVACLCRDRKTFEQVMIVYFLIGFLVSFLLNWQVYPALSAMSVNGFNEASMVRFSVGKYFFVDQNLNFIGLIASCSAVVSVVIATHPYNTLYLFNHKLVRWFLPVMSGIALFLPMSRSAVLVASVLVTIYLIVNFKKKIKNIVAFTVGSLIVIFVVPNVSLSRMAFFNTQKEDIRVGLLVIATESILDYFWLGVGAGPYHNSWGVEHHLAGHGVRTGVIGLHNVYFQILVNWGIGALILYLIAVIWVLKRISFFSDDFYFVMLSMLILVSFGYTFFSHQFYDKAYSLLWGVLIAFYEMKLLRLPNSQERQIN